MVSTCPSSFNQPKPAKMHGHTFPESRRVDFNVFKYRSIGIVPTPSFVNIQEWLADPAADKLTRELAPKNGMQTAIPGFCL